MNTLLQLAGVGQLALALGSLAVPKMLGGRMTPPSSASFLDVRRVYLGDQPLFRCVINARTRVAPERFAPRTRGRGIHRRLLGGSRLGPVPLLRSLGRSGRRILQAS